jgi:hypothetical protein
VLFRFIFLSKKFISYKFINFYKCWYQETMMANGTIIKVGHADYEVEMSLTGERAMWVDRLRNSGLYGSSRSQTVEDMWPDWIDFHFDSENFKRLSEECKRLGYFRRESWPNRRYAAFRKRQIALDRSSSGDSYPILLGMGGYMAFILERIERIYPSINTKFEGIELLVDDWFRVQNPNTEKIVPGIAGFISHLRGTASSIALLDESLSLPSKDLVF